MVGVVVVAAVVVAVLVGAAVVVVDSRVAALVVAVTGDFGDFDVVAAVEAVVALVTGVSLVEKLSLKANPPRSKPPLMAMEGSSPPQVISHSPKVSNRLRLPRHPP